MAQFNEDRIGKPPVPVSDSQWKSVLAAFSADELNAFDALSSSAAQGVQSHSDPASDADAANEARNCIQDYYNRRRD